MAIIFAKPSYQPLNHSGLIHNIFINLSLLSSYIGWIFLSIYLLAKTIWNLKTHGWREKMVCHVGSGLLSHLLSPHCRPSPDSLTVLPSRGQN